MTNWNESVVFKTEKEIAADLKRRLREELPSRPVAPENKFPGKCAGEGCGRHIGRHAGRIKKTAGGKWAVYGYACCAVDAGLA